MQRSLMMDGEKKMKEVIETLLESLSLIILTVMDKGKTIEFC
jgi:methyltransferase-like protein